jgi:magnesium-transporting ATPase (P-type)
VLVKRLVAIEDLGNIEILFTDKTGTLTEGVITFERGLDAERSGQPIEPLLLGLVCNEATVTEGAPGRWQCAGPGPLVGARRSDRRAARHGAQRMSEWASFPLITSASWLGAGQGSDGAGS